MGHIGSKLLAHIRSGQYFLMLLTYFSCEGNQLRVAVFLPHMLHISRHIFNGLYDGCRQIMGKYQTHNRQQSRSTHHHRKR